jgi:hypothetical protein
LLCTTGGSGGGDDRERHGHPEQRPGDAASPPEYAEEAVFHGVAERELPKLIEQGPCRYEWDWKSPAIRCAFARAVQRGVTINNSSHRDQLEAKEL